MNQAAIQNFSYLFDNAIKQAHDRGDPEWRRQQREMAFSHFLEVGFPDVKQEEWKYTNVMPIMEKEFVLPKIERIPDISELLGKRWNDAIEFVFVDGVLSMEHSTTTTKQGIEVILFRDAMLNGDGALLRSRIEACLFDNSSAFPLLNQAFGEDGVWVKIANDAVIEEHVHFIFISTIPNVLLSPCVIIDAGHSSQASLVQSHIGSPGVGSFTSAVTDIHVAENANLTYCKVQSEAADSFHYGRIQSTQMEDSCVTHFDFSCGSSLARNELHARLDGERAEVHLNGLYAVKDRQHIDNHTIVDHKVPCCYSRQCYKGILNNTSRAVFNGTIIVQPGAVNTDGVQLNKNLLLSRDARVYTKPQLEILNNDVKCTHGATTGQINEEHLFYAMSRGINQEEAIAMLARGFVEDILYLIGEKALQKFLQGLLASYFSN